MTSSFKKSITISLSCLWIGSFIILVILINNGFKNLSMTKESLSQRSTQINQLASDIDHLTHKTTENNQTLATLQKVLEYMPQTEAHVRSQKALMDDVQAIRNKISQQLKGRLHILVDTKANILYLKQGMKLIFQADCSVGKGGIFSDKKTGRRWEFNTPRGKFRVLGKYENPVWIKPDWAFVEEGEAPPPPDDPKRRVEGELGAYLLNLGNGYLIHGTKHEELLGKPASHGCVRLGADNLKKLYEATSTGIDVYIY